MSILTDIDIRRAIADGKIKIEPFSDDMVQPGSLEMSLGNKFRIFRYDRLKAGEVIDTKNGMDEPEGLTELVELKDDGSEAFYLSPRELVLASTRETLAISPDIAGRIEGRSSFARIGVMVHVTAGFIHPGSSGHQTLEISNMLNIPVKLYPGLRMCQIIFSTTTSPAQTPYGKMKNSKYYNQQGPDRSGLFMK